MRKEYIIFIAILAGLLLVYAITRSFIGGQKDQAGRVKDAASDKYQLDKLERKVDAKFAELEKLIDTRLDSLERVDRETEVPFDSTTDSLPPQPAPLTVVETVTVIDTFTAPAETVRVEVGPPAEQKKPDNAPTEVEVRIYDQYLKKRCALTGDLTSYELSVAKGEIHEDLGKAYDLLPAEIASIIDKVYHYRKSGGKE
ncbi:MAG: hypothetical protein ABIJ61_09365 [bacterium]